MAYQEVLTPANPAAVIDAIRAFAEANGWTVMRNNLVGNNRTVTLKRPETDYVHIYNLDLNNVYLRMSISYAAGTAPDSMADRSQRAWCSTDAGPYTRLFLFGGTTPTAHVHCVLEGNTAGQFYHMSFGMVEKLDAWTGGTYVDGTYWRPASAGSQIQFYSGNFTHALFGSDQTTNTNPLQGTSTSYVAGGMRCDFAADSRVDSWAGWSGQSLSTTAAGVNTFKVMAGIKPPRSNPTQNINVSTGNAEGTQLAALSAVADDNYFSNRSIFHPIELSVGRIGGYISPVGSVPNIRFCNVSKFTDGQEVTIGSDVWKVFAMHKRGIGAGSGSGADPYLPGSENYGYAYLKTT